MPHIRKRDVAAIWEACDRADAALMILSSPTRTTDELAGGTDAPAALADLGSCVTSIRVLLPARSVRKLEEATDKHEKQARIGRKTAGKAKKARKAKSVRKVKRS